MRRLENFSADIPASLQRADYILTRYGRWAMARRVHHRCGSAEGAYRAPQNDSDRVPRELVMPLHDAMRAQRALAKVPMLERMVLAILYIPQRMPVEAQLRRLRVQPSQARERHLYGLRVFADIHGA